MRGRGDFGGARFITILTSMRGRRAASQCGGQVGAQASASAGDEKGLVARALSLFGDALRLPVATLRSAYWSLVLRRSGRPFPPSLTHSTVVLYYQCIPSTSRSTLSLSPVSQPAFRFQIPLPLSTIVYILVL